MQQPAIGTTYPEYEGRIDEDAAVAYAAATNDPNAVYVGGGAVPPLYTSALIQPAHAEAESKSLPDGWVTGYSSTVHAEHDVRFAQPVVPGMAVRLRATSRSLRQTPAGAMYTNQIAVTNIAGELLVEHLWSTIYVGGTVPEDLGPELPEHRFPEDARARPSGSETFEITTDQTYRYGGVSGDRVGHSMDDETARREGFPRKIVQGMCTFAMCGAAVVKIAGDGEPDRLRRLAGRFAATVHPRQKLVVEVFDAGQTDAGDRVVAFEASADGLAVIKHGRAELAAL